MSNTMTIEALVERVELLETQMAKMTVTPTDVPNKPIKDAKKGKSVEEKKEKKEKKEKDLDKPKRAPSAYNMFCKKMRPEASSKVVEEEELNEGDKIPTTKVMQMLGKMWKELSEDEQQAYKPSSDNEE